LENVTFPVSQVTTYSNSGTEVSLVSALGRAVGDYVFYWDFRIPVIPRELLDTFILQSDRGAEYVAVSFRQSRSSRVAYKFLNALGASTHPFSRFYSGFLSRRLLGQILTFAETGFDVELILSKTHLSRHLIDYPLLSVPKEPLIERVNRARFFLTKGSKLGSLLPSLLATLSSFFALVAAVYSLIIYVFEGKTPEGWTTLMVLVGFGQAAILLMLALTWSQITELQNFRKGIDISDEVKVFGIDAPNKIGPCES
jgi:hypothetical protein